MSLLDYQGRKFDVLALPGNTPTGDALLTQELFGIGNTGQICAGVVKLAQRWTLEFLTEKGTLIYLPTRGTQFMTDARLGRLHTELDVMNSFNFSMIDLKRSLQGEETASMPNDERYASASILALAILPDFLSLTVQVNSLAGTNRQVILPIDVDY